MKPVTFGQKNIRRLYELPKIYNAEKQIIMSHKYITNAYIIFTHDAVKNKGEVLKSNDGEKFFFNPAGICKYGKIDTDQIKPPMYDNQIETAVTPQGHDFNVRPLIIKKTHLMLRTSVDTLQVWLTDDNKTQIFFSNAFMTQYGIDDNTLHGWENNRLFLDSPENDFRMGIMPIESNVLTIKDTQSLRDTLQDIIESLSNN